MARNQNSAPSNPRTVELWNQALSHEKNLRSLLRRKNFYDVEARNLRQELRKTYVEIMFVDPQFSHDAEVEQMLWKSVYYRMIEEFRSRIRSTVSAGDVARQAHAKVLTAFFKLIKDATAFYEGLVERFQQQSQTSDPLPSSSISPSPTLSIHRCLIYLGDLCRYHAQTLTSSTRAEGKQESTEAWKRASTYYKRAAAVCPSSGNPFNQLAVMAYYTNDELRAVYYYFRSLSVSCPFQTAKENLIMLFEKNRTKYAALPPTQAAAGRAPSTAAPSPIPPLIQDVSTRFVRLHGILYDRINAETLPAVQTKAFASLATLLSTPAALTHLRKSPPHDNLLLHLAVTCIYSAHHHHSRAAAAAARPGPDRADDILAATTLAAQSTTILLTYLSTLIAHCDPTHQPLMAAIFILLHWLHLQPSVLAPPLNSTPPYLAASTALLQALPTLPPLLSRHAASSNAPRASSPPLLPEVLDLVGFQPLAFPTPAGHPTLTPCPPPQQPAARTAQLLAVLASIQAATPPPPGADTDPSLPAALSAATAATARPLRLSPPPPALPHTTSPKLNIPTARTPLPNGTPSNPTLNKNNEDNNGQDEDEEDEEEVIVFKPRSSRASTATTHDSFSALPTSTDGPPSRPPSAPSSQPPSSHTHPPISTPAPQPLPPTYPTTYPLDSSILPPSTSAPLPSTTSALPLPRHSNSSTSLSGHTSLNKDLASFYSRPQSPQLSQPSHVSNPSPMLDTKLSCPHPTASPPPPLLPADPPRHSTPLLDDSNDHTWLTSISNAHLNQPHPSPAQPPPSQPHAAFSSSPHGTTPPVQPFKAASALQPHWSTSSPSLPPTSIPHLNPHEPLQPPSTTHSLPHDPWGAATFMDQLDSSLPPPQQPALQQHQVQQQQQQQQSIFGGLRGANTVLSGGLRGSYGTVQRPESVHSDATMTPSAHTPEGMRAAMPNSSPHEAGVGSSGRDGPADMSVDLPSGTDDLRRMLGVSGGGGGGLGTTPLPRSNPSPVRRLQLRQSQAPPAADSSTMFGALFDGKDVFHHVRQGSGGAPQLAGDAAVGDLMGAGYSLPVSRVATPVDPAILDSSGPSGLGPGQWGLGGGTHGQWAQGGSGPLRPELGGPGLLQPIAQPPLGQSSGFSFIDLLQEQQQQQQQQLPLDDYGQPAANPGIGMLLPQYQQQYQQQYQPHEYQQQQFPQQHQPLNQVENLFAPQHGFGGLGTDMYGNAQAFGAPPAMYGGAVGGPGLGFGTQQLLPGTHQ